MVVSPSLLPELQVRPPSKEIDAPPSLASMIRSGSPGSIQSP
jgi:hypothetical protein